MEIGGYGFEKSELLKVAEKIYEYKSKKKDVELKLSSEKFHHQYIPKRKNLVEHEVMFRLLFIVPLTILVISAFSFFVFCLLDSDGSKIDGVSLLVCALALVFAGYADVKLIIREFRMLMLLYISFKPEKAVQFARKYDINTFQSDEEKSKEKIKAYEEQIVYYDKKIEELEEKQKQLLCEKEKNDNFLREQGVLFDEKPEKTDTKSGFTLRKESLGSQNIRELFEFYGKEEQYINDCMNKLDTDIQIINREIVKIDEEFENVKKTLIFAGIIYILVVLIQGVFSGILYTMTSLICIVASVVAIVYLEGKCKRPILMYLVEHESSLTREYAFCNNLFPVKNKRAELLETMEEYKNQLADIRKKKSEIEI